MKIETFLSMAKSGRLRLFQRAARDIKSVHRACVLSAAATSGVLHALAAGPLTLEALLQHLEAKPNMRDAVEAWLEVGVKLGELREEGGVYTLHGSLARHLAEPGNDDILAFLEEAVSLHHTLLVDLPARAKEGRPFTLSDQDGALVARSSRTLEALVGEAINEMVPKSGAMRLLEVGCGSGVHIRRAAERNPDLQVLALELQPDVADIARRNIAEWGLSGRVRVELRDVREMRPTPEFDLATLHNNIYYFPVGERVTLLAHVRAFLKPGGRLLLTTGCTGGSAAMHVLSLWGAATEGCGRLPSAREVSSQLKEAGYGAVDRAILLPGDSYFAFTAVNPS